MKSQPEIVILLSTYNGDKYLVEQLESLLKQSYSNFIIIIRDDGSSDETQKIITDYVTRNRNKIYSLPFDQRNIGPSASFCLLIQYALEEKESFGFSRIYMMLCDQDDIWMERKIEIQMSEMLSTEQEAGGWPGSEEGREEDEKYKERRERNHNVDEIEQGKAWVRS